MSAFTLPLLFESRVKELGEMVALREKKKGLWRPISWNEYYAHVKNFCLGLKSFNLQKGDRVSILGDNCPEWLYADLATQAAGGVSVGVYPTNSTVQVKYILDHSQSKFVIVKDQEQTDKVLMIKDQLPFLEKVIVIDMKGLRKYDDPLLTSFHEVEEIGKRIHENDPLLFQGMIEQTQSDDVAIIVYTSGTTGPPKGAMLSHRNITSVLDSFFEVLPITRTDSLISVLPLCHVAERLFSLFIPMKSGCTINFAESIDTLQADMTEISPTIFLTVPRILEKIHSAITIKMQDAHPIKRWAYYKFLPLGQRVAERRLSKKDIPFFLRLAHFFAYLLVFRPLRNRLGLLQVRECVSGAAPLSKDIMKFFHSIGLMVKEAYGSTECTGVFSMPAGEDIEIGTTGKPIPGWEYKIASDGEILMKGPAVFTGYFRDETATNQAKRDGWLYTGDIGEFDDKGNLKITDRKKEILITASGKNIAPSEIENRLKFSPFIKEAIIIGDRRPYLAALIQIDLDNVADWAQRQGIPFTTFRSLSRDPQVYNLIQGEVDKTNQEMSRIEGIKKFVLLEKELDRDDDELTATMKVRREMIEKKYGDLIERLYK
ncbi:MAG: AMP-binding protein [Syntrophaceae bacterium]|nr:AMP-binding protein [Syntrophaceae bacterium]